MPHFAEVVFDSASAKGQLEGSPESAEGQKPAETSGGQAVAQSVDSSSLMTPMYLKHGQ